MNTSTNCAAYQLFDVLAPLRSPGDPPEHPCSWGRHCSWGPRSLYCCESVNPYAEHSPRARVASSGARAQVLADPSERHDLYGLPEHAPAPPRGS